MKRHEKLQPLSRQHHNGLLAALLVKKGIAKSADPDVMSAFIVNFWDEDLKAHFEREEEVLIPSLLNTSFDKNLSDQLLREHALIRSYIDSLRSKTGDMSVITAFADTLERHIRFEERRYFPEAEQVLSEEQLQKLGEQLKEEERQNCLYYPLKFWQ
jgi:hemerythrin-like domain-containing protein